MAAMQKLRADQLKYGEPLPCDICDESGRLLLCKGFVISSREQIESLLIRGMYAEAAHFQSAAPVSVAPRTTPLRDWEGLQGHLGIILQTPPTDGSLLIEFNDIAQLLTQLTDRHADMVLAAIMLMDHRRYPVAHSLHAAAIASMVAHRASWSAEQRQSLVCAALSMNVGMMALQLQLCNQREKLTPAQRLAVDQHPALGVQILQNCGVEDPEWLRAVLEHHEKHDGTGYPRKIIEPSHAAMVLQTADIFAAKISPRTHRKPMIASEATKVAYVELSENGRNPYPAILIKEIGIYPRGPWSNSRMANRAWYRKGARLPTPQSLPC